MLIAISCGASGLLSGWLLRAPLRSQHTAADQTNSETARDEERLHRVASQLRSMTMDMAANVDAHQTRVREVSDALTDDDDANPETVFNAVADLIQANHEMQKQLGDAQTQIRVQEEAIQSAEKRALTDGLTRLCNRRGFDEHTRERHGMEDKEANPTTLMIIDVDHFKQFNDVYGHRTGDEVLKHVASQLESRLSSKGLVARYGGEEFAVVFDDLPIHEIRQQADEVRAEIGNRDFIIDDQRLRITASAGLAQLLNDESIDNWIERADSALYTAKEEGRNRAYWMDKTVPLPVEQPTEDEDQTQHEDEEALIEPDEEATTDGKASLLETLPNLSDLKEYGRSKLESFRAEGMPFCVLIVKIENEIVSEQQLKSALGVIRASVRSIDAGRIGYSDESTLIVLLPSADEGVAQERSELITTGIEKIPNENEPLNATVAVSTAEESESFNELLGRAFEKLESSAALSS